uniref:ShKT domain-containing protein n=1 Tax=Ditylenchus dipsaci TaxID=166011 RepID=A0A915E398_9BILA
MTLRECSAFSSVLLLTCVGAHATYRSSVLPTLAVDCHVYISTSIGVLLVLCLWLYQRMLVDKKVDLTSLYSGSELGLDLSIGAPKNAKKWKDKTPSDDPKAMELAEKAVEHARQAHELATTEKSELKAAKENAEKAEVEWDNYSEQVDKLGTAVNSFENSVKDSKDASDDEVAKAAEFHSKRPKTVVDRLIVVRRLVIVYQKMVVQHHKGHQKSSQKWGSSQGPNSSQNKKDPANDAGNPSSPQNKVNSAKDANDPSSPRNKRDSAGKSSNAQDNGGSAHVNSVPSTELKDCEAKFELGMRQLETDIGSAKTVESTLKEKENKRIQKHDEEKANKEKVKSAKTNLDSFKNAAEEAERQTKAKQKDFEKIKGAHRQHYEEFEKIKQAVKDKIHDKAIETNEHKHEAESILENADEILKEAELTEKHSKEHATKTKTLEEIAQKALNDLSAKKKELKKVKSDSETKLKKLERSKKVMEVEVNKMRHASTQEALEMETKAHDSKSAEAIEHAKTAAQAVQRAVPKIEQEFDRLLEATKSAQKVVEEIINAEKKIETSHKKAEEFLEKAQQAYKAAQKSSEEAEDHHQLTKQNKDKAVQLLEDEDVKKEFKNSKTQVISLNNEARKASGMLFADSKKANSEWGSAVKAQDDYDSTSSAVVDSLTEIEKKKLELSEGEEKYNAVKGQATDSFTEYEQAKWEVEKVIGAMPPPPPLVTTAISVSHLNPKTESKSLLYNSVMEVAAKEGDENRGDNIMDSDTPTTDRNAGDLTCKNKLSEKKCNQLFEPRNGHANSACKDKALRLKSLNCAKTCHKCSEYKRVMRRKLRKQEKRDKKHWIVKKKTHCKDKSKSCSKKIFNCEKPKYAKKLKKRCPHSCGFCLAPQDKCVDTNANRCAKWKELGFCQKPEYPRAVKWFYCAHTCQMCPPDEPTTSDHAPKSQLLLSKPANILCCSKTAFWQLVKQEWVEEGLTDVGSRKSTLLQRLFALWENLFTFPVYISNSLV